MARWPEWWEWELEITPHLERRMLDRRFDELELRAMLQRATGCHAVEETGRFAIVTMRTRRAWRIIVEPDAAEQVLVVITAYEVG